MSINYGERALLKLNLRLFLDMIFLRNGGFFNVASGTQFYDGSDMSVFLPDAEAHNYYQGLQVGQIFQSPFRQFVYESGVIIDGPQDPPIVMSGLLIEGSFRGTGDPEFGHTIDFFNGRVIFNDPQSLNLKVNAAFSYREVRLGFASDFNNQFQQGYLESKYATNPGTSSHIVYPSGFAQPFPAVFIDVDERDFESYELGNRSLILKDMVKLHIWALHDIQRDNIFDILTGQMRKSLPLVNFNKVPLPLSGIHNTLSLEYIPYQTLLQNNLTVTTVGSGLSVSHIAYFDQVTGRNMAVAEEFERALVTLKVDRYLNAPTTPIPTLFTPVTTLPQLEDFF